MPRALVLQMAAMGVIATCAAPTLSIAQIPIRLADPNGSVAPWLGPPPTRAAEGRSEQGGISGINVRAGNWYRLAWYFNLDAECRPIDVQIEATVYPRHGKISVAEMKTPFGQAGKALILNPDDPRLKCPDGEYPGKLIIYTPEADYSGPDEAVITIHDRKFVSTNKYSFQVTQ